MLASCVRFDDFAVSVFHCVRCLNLASNSDDRRLCVCCAGDFGSRLSHSLARASQIALHGILPLFSPQKPASLSLSLFHSRASEGEKREDVKGHIHSLTLSQSVIHLLQKQQQQLKEQEESNARARLHRNSSSNSIRATGSQSSAGAAAAVASSSLERVND